MKRYPTSLVIWGLKIKTTTRYYFTSTKMAIIFKNKKKEERKRLISVGKDVEKLEPSFIVHQQSDLFLLYYAETLGTYHSY